MVAVEKNHAVNNDQIDALSESIGTEPSNSSPKRVVNKEVDSEGEVEDVFDDDKSAAFEQVRLLQETIAANAAASEEQTRLAKEATREAKSVNKEVRRLRQHVVDFNADLKSAENEIDAQRNELERAATRMDRDRVRHIEEKERWEKDHSKSMASIQPNCY
mmetsp:Transcript_54981/g.66188  ORF Transcript_54981/g.66188 Transcript_54981/m.66188 type:complete len:161 (+) Transcript_54981:616-1098(+)